MMMMLMMMIRVFSACPKNTFKSGSSECSNCPINSETSGEASSRTDCRCKTGFTGTPGQTCTGRYQHVTLTPGKPAQVPTMLHSSNQTCTGRYQHVTLNPGKPAQVPTMLHSSNQTCTGRYKHVTLNPGKRAEVGTNTLHYPGQTCIGMNQHVTPQV